MVEACQVAVVYRHLASKRIAARAMRQFRRNRRVGGWQENAAALLRREECRFRLDTQNLVVLAGHDVIRIDAALQELLVSIAAGADGGEPLFWRT